MEASEEKYFMVFRSSNHAVLLYNELLKEGCNVELVSTPCRLSRGCSQSIIINSSDIQKIITVVKKNNIVVANIYKIIDNQGTIDYLSIS